MEGSKELNGISIMESIKLFFKISILEALYLALFALLFVTPFSILDTYFFKFRSADEITLYIRELCSILSYIIVISKIKKSNLEENFQLKILYKPRLKEYIYVILVAIAYHFIYSNTLRLLLSSSPILRWYEQSFNGSIEPPMLLIIISGCIVAPIFEEVIYRGIILEQLYRRYGILKAIIVSSLFFGITHLNLYQGLNAFFIGIILGFIYIKTNSLLLSIFLHFASNALVVIQMFTPLIYSINVKFNLVQLLFGVILLLIVYKFFNNIEIDSNRKFNLKIISKVNNSKTLDTDGN